MQKHSNVKNTKGEREKLETFYRYKMATLIKLVKSFTASNAKQDSKDPPGEMPDDLVRDLIRKIILYSKYYNRQVISYKHAETALKELGYSSDQIFAILSLVEMNKLTSKYSSLMTGTVKLTQGSFVDPVQPKTVTVLKHDFKNWKRKNPKNHFVVSKHYPYLIEELLTRNWVPAESTSLYFDFKFVTKAKYISFENINENQVINHNAEFETINCKSQLYRLLISLSNQYEIDKFLPRCYDLKCYRDHANFIEDYKLSQSLVFLTKFIENTHLDDIMIYKSLIGYSCLKNYLDLMLKGRLVDSLLYNEELDFLCNDKMTYHEYITYENANPVRELCKRVELLVDCDVETGLFLYELRKVIAKALEQIRKIDPQLHLTNITNSWVLKPSGQSREVRVHLLSKYRDILKILIESDTEWIVQKYIERPLKIENSDVG